MDETSAPMESELLDLSGENVVTLRSLELSSIAAAVERVREMVADSEGSVSNYNPSFASGPEEGTAEEDNVA